MREGKITCLSPTKPEKEINSWRSWSARSGKKDHSLRASKIWALIEVDETMEHGREYFSSWAWPGGEAARGLGYIENNNNVREKRKKTSRKR